MKPLGHKAYGSIPHLPGSQRGPADRGLTDAQARLLTHTPRRGDRILVTEKLDGTCVAVAKLQGQIVPLGRAGYRAETSRQEQHALFAAYVMQRWQAFDALLREGERLCAEWLAMAHGVRYDLAGRPPLAAFDLMRGHKRALYDDLRSRLAGLGDVVQPAPLLHEGAALPVEEAMARLGAGHYGAVDVPEGVVYRVERQERCDFLGKYVRADFVPGRYFAEHQPDGRPVWNWRPPERRPAQSG